MVETLVFRRSKFLIVAKRDVIPANEPESSIFQIGSPILDWGFE